MRKASLAEAVNWYFASGYKELAKNPDTPTQQSLVGSSFLRLKKVSETMNISPADALLITYEGRMNGKSK